MKIISIFLSIIISALMTLSAADKAKYIFLFIGDGMGLGHVMLTQYYNQRALGNSEPILMTQFPVASMAYTYSASNLITDSAAAGTALSTGHKTRNGMIGENADSISVNSVAKTLHDAGFGVGIASTVAGDDATPAAFYAHAHSRGMSKEIAAQAATSGYEFFGAPIWRGGRNDEWLELMKSNGYNVCIGYDNYCQSPKSSDKTLLLSANPQGDQAGYAIDSIPNGLTATQLTSACLNHLKRTSPDKFFMMIEGGNIDWAAHANDGGTVIKEIYAFQDAINVAYQFYLKHPDETLIVVTADHDTGGMAYGRYDMGAGDLNYLRCQKVSKDAFQSQCQKFLAAEQSCSWEQMQQYLQDKLGFFSTIKIRERDEQKLKEAFETTFTRREGVDERTLYNNFNQFVVLVFNILNREIGIAWTSGYHTANAVPVYAIGVGSEEFSKACNNIEIPQKISTIALGK